MKKAEKQLKKERVMRVLKKARAAPPNNRNSGGGMNGFGASVQGGKLLAVRMVRMNQDRRVLANMEDRLYQLEDGEL
jgi:hypothetical protein